jgi:argininosuccinate lyase
VATNKPWGGRFTEDVNALALAFSGSIETDKHIALDDVEGSLAHAQMLAEVGLITAEHGQKIHDGLEKVRAELLAGTFPWDASFEDVHMNVERRLAHFAGEDAAGRLHTARSRNDQVALDARLYLRRRLTEIRGHLVAMEQALVDQADAHVGTLLPGYTHMQRAQPVRLGHHLLAYREMMKRDRGRIDDLLRRALVSPLGSGALSGTPHPIQRERVAEILGLNGITANSLDAVSDRDAMLEAMSAASISMMHLSRLSEELVLWSTIEFGFIEIGEAFTTGSSMMPQKKNPDMAELVRGKCGRVVGDLVALLITMKGLPLSYNRDMQEDKPALVDALDTWSSSVAITAAMIPAVKFKVENMRRALSDGFVTATELADYLVTKGVPFRDAHHVVGRIVGACVASGRRLEDLKIDELKAENTAFEPDVFSWIDPEKAVERRQVPGGPARAFVQEAIRRAREELSHEG